MNPSMETYYQFREIPGEGPAIYDVAETKRRIMPVSINKSDRDVDFNFNTMITLSVGRY